MPEGFEAGMSHESPRPQWARSTLHSRPHALQMPPLIKTLEEETGIGRPSTYAAIIKTIHEPRIRHSARVSHFKPTELVRSHYKADEKERFPDLVNIKFTRRR